MYLLHKTIKITSFCNRQMAESVVILIEAYDIATGDFAYAMSIDRLVTSIIVADNKLVGYAPEENISKLYVWEIHNKVNL